MDINFYYQDVDFLENNIPETGELVYSKKIFAWFLLTLPKFLARLKIGCTVYMLVLNTGPGVIKQCMKECKHQDLE